MPDALTSSLANFVFTSDDDDGDDGDLSPAFLVWLDWIRTVSDGLPPYHHLKGDFDTLLIPDPSPLFAMTVFGLPSVLDHLPSAADLEAQTERGHTGLYLASLHGHLDMAEALLARGANPDVQCGSHGSPLGAACYWGHGSVVKMLLSHEAMSRSQGVFEMAFEKACAGQHESIAMMLVQYAGFPRETKNLKKADAITIAAAHSHLGMVKFLHDDQGFSASVESRLGFPLRNAFLIGHVPIVRTLLDWGEDIDGRGERVLLENGADVGQKGKFKDAFYAAVKGGHEAVAAELLERGYKSVPPDDSAGNGRGLPAIARGDEAVSNDEGVGFRGKDEEDARDPYADEDGGEDDSEDADSFESLTRRLPPDKGYLEACIKFATEEGNLGLLEMTLAEAATQLKDPESSFLKDVAIAASARRFEVVEFLVDHLGTLPYETWRETLLVVTTIGNPAFIARSLNYCSEVDMIEL
ncbi:hypothetical protein N0V88_007688 [Collariella sp. IMI 366227]|nr:hypothetical protein N0V88_007688 [Collariella sp. IMI 366227]